MFVLTAKIQIKSKNKTWTFSNVTSVEISRDVSNLTDECKVTLPRRLRWKDEAETPVRHGDNISVWLGYDGNLELAFQGYVRDVGVKTPVVLSCEDEMFLLKRQATLPKAYKSVDLKTLLSDQNPGCEVRVQGEQQIGAYRVTAKTVAELLDGLQRQGVRSFFRTEDGKPVLYCGVMFDRGTKVSQVFSTGFNIISDRLEQQKAEAMRLKVKAVSIMPDNKKITVEVGDKDGELRTVYTYNKQEKELKAWAEQEMQRLRQDGLKGSLTTFGAKLVDKLDIVGVKIDGRRMGTYQVQKNVIKYGTAGYRQELTLGRKVGD